jgi:lipid-binding SYLF domain-containing protein
MQKLRFAALAAAVSFLAIGAPAAARDPARTIDSSSAVLREFLDLSVKQIPAGMLADAHGVAIVPNVIKLGFVVGGQRGHGVVIVREKDGSWRAPTFMTLTGGSIGWQIGAQATDFVLVFKTQKSVDGLLAGKFTIGADAAAAAGPVGRRAGAATDGELKAEIYTYSRTRGLFAGISLDGSVIDIDHDDNAAYYGVTRPGEAAPAPPEAAVALTQIVPTPALPRNSLEGPALGPANSIPGQPTLAAPSGLPGNVLPGSAQPTVTRPVERSLIVPAPAEAGQPVLDLTQPAVPLADAADVQRELARSARQLSVLVDRNWQRYLELPDEVYREGKRPSSKELKAAVDRFDRVAADPRYQPLAERPEFQATRDLLHVYLDTLDARNSPKLALPPPPNGNR